MYSGIEKDDKRAILEQVGTNSLKTFLGSEKPQYTKAKSWRQWIALGLKSRPINEMFDMSAIDRPPEGHIFSRVHVTIYITLSSGPLPSHGHLSSNLELKKVLWVKLR